MGVPGCLMKYLIHIAYIVIILVIILFLNKSCNDVKEAIVLWKGVKTEAEEYKQEVYQFKKKLQAEMAKPAKIVYKTKIIKKSSGQEITHDNAESQEYQEYQKCFEKYSKSLEVCDENTGICYTDDNIFDESAGNFNFTPRFYSLLGDIYADTRLEREQKIWNFHLGGILENHQGIGVYVQEISLKKILKVSMGIGGGITYDLQEPKKSRFIAGINYNIWGNIFVMAGYGRSIKHNYGIVGIGIYLY